MIDYRSDTVTRPSAAMREAMARAEVGDDVYGDDPTVRELETRTAQLLGKQAAVFVASGTMSNLLGIMAHCERGDEYIVAQGAHTYRFEGGGAAVLGSVQPQPVETGANGAISAEQIRREAKRSGDPHLARTRLVALENAFWGRVQSLEEMESATRTAHELGLATHLDGARIFNAATALGEHPSRLAESFDSVSVCLSKGLGAPVGSVLVGSTEVIDGARRWRKVLGGGWRQAGLLAAAGLFALDHNVSRIGEDHRRATELATQLHEIEPLRVDLDAVETSMVFVELDEEYRGSFEQALQVADIAVGGRGSYRFVLHLDIADEDVERTVEVVRAWAAKV